MLFFYKYKKKKKLSISDKKKKKKFKYDNLLEKKSTSDSLIHLPLNRKRLMLHYKFKIIKLLRKKGLLKSARSSKKNIHKKKKKKIEDEAIKKICIKSLILKNLFLSGLDGRVNLKNCLRDENILRNIKINLINNKNHE